MNIGWLGARGLIAFILGSAGMLACAGNATQPPASAASNAIASPTEKPSQTAAPTDIASAGRTLVADIIAGNANLAKTHPLFMLGPALYARVLAEDPAFEHVGTGVSLMSAEDPNKTQNARMCAEETCEAFFRGKGLRAVLTAFARATYRDPSPVERQVILDRTPEMFPKDGPFTVAAAGPQLLAFSSLDHSIVWVELISEASLVTATPDANAPSTPSSRALAATKCLKVDTIGLDQTEEQFAENTTAQSVTEGVTSVIQTLDALLLARKSTATGTWSMHVTFDAKGISIIAGPPKALVDPSVIPALAQRTVHHAPVSRGAVLSLSVELTLNPCGR